MGQLKVLIASSEIAPFAKTGGLADVCGSLPLALEEMGVDVRVIMPKHSSVRVDSDNAVIGKNIKAYFVEHDAYFRRPDLYGDRFGDYRDNLDRFAYFSKEALERCKREGFAPDIIHCNDWHTALIPVYLNTHYKLDPYFEKTRTLITIHNLGYQGHYPKEEFYKLNLDWSLFDIQHFEFYGKINLMKAGIVFANAINTVSPTYAKEIMTREFGCGLEGVLAERKDDVYGVLNGIDYTRWNPQTDGNIFKTYNIEAVTDKYINKEGLQRELQLKNNNGAPLIGMITRLAEQKGADLVAEIIDGLLNMKMQFVLLGMGDNKFHFLFDRIARKYISNTSINLRFDPILADKMYAACDMILIPSRYEPCGLSQMISLRYGTIPVARMTGGLKDTVTEYDQASGSGNGFTFYDYRSRDFYEAIKRAMAVYQDKDAWLGLVKRAMAMDFSWKNSAQHYVDLYKKILEKG